MFFVFPDSHRRLSCCQDLSLFRRGLVQSSVLFIARCFSGASPHAVQASSVIFFLVVSTIFACCRVILVSFTGPVRALSQFWFSAAIVVLFLPLWCAHSGSARDLRHSCPPWRPTCIGYRGSWSPTDWSFNRQVCTLCAFLGSNLGAASWRSGGDTVESLSNVCWCWPPLAAETDLLTLLSKIMIV